MANMSYCRFSNTLGDLRDCYDNWDDAESLAELRAQKKLYALAKEIVEDCSPPSDARIAEMKAEEGE